LPSLRFVETLGDAVGKLFTESSVIALRFYESA
jgi:hypothetical protein